jgi:hypothetical protein
LICFDGVKGKPGNQPMKNESDESSDGKDESETGEMKLLKKHQVSNR